MTKKYYKYSEYTKYVDFKRLDFIIKSISDHFNKDIKGLDVGCGKGNITITLAYLGYLMVGVDISPQNIEISKSKRITDNNPTFLVGDAENLRFKKKSFDFVICSEVLEHLKYPKKALNSMHEVLKENGLLIVTIPNGYGPYSLIFDHFRNKILSRIFPNIGRSDHQKTFTITQMSKMLKKAKFEVLSIKHSNFISFLPILADSHKIDYWDCILADKLPHELVSGYYIVCRKRRNANS